jgi:hypothetical protein
MTDPFAPPQQSLEPDAKFVDAAAIAIYAALNSFDSSPEGLEARAALAFTQARVLGIEQVTQANARYLAHLRALRA